MDASSHWVGTWTTAPAPSEAGITFNNQTVRMHPRVSVGGKTLRVRVSNAYGNGKLVIGAASVALRDKGPAIVPDSERRLTFSGFDGATVPAGALVISDPVSLDVPPLGDLAVSLYLPREIPPTFQITGRYARQTNYISPPGDHCAAITMPVLKITDEWFFVCGVDVLASRDTGGVVALGDSLTDCNISTHDAYCRWPDQLARRLIARARQGGRPLGVMNQGLGGNRMLHDIRGDSGLRRFDRDVLAQPGATHAIVKLGTNDLINRWGKPDEEVTADQIIAGLQQMAVRARGRGVKLFGATVAPFGNQTFVPGGWNAEREAHRLAINKWMRDSTLLDGVIDFDQLLGDPARPSKMLSDYASNDGLHPSDNGYRAMGDAIDLALFD